MLFSVLSRSLSIVCKFWCCVLFHLSMKQINTLHIRYFHSIFRRTNDISMCQTHALPLHRYTNTHTERRYIRAYTHARIHVYAHCLCEVYVIRTVYTQIYVNESCEMSTPTIEIKILVKRFNFCLRFIRLKCE